MTKAQRAALAVITGCPGGVNEAALAGLGIGRAILDRLVLAGLVRAETYTMHNPRGLIVRRYFATEAGR